MQIKDKRVIVTGAASDLGLTFSRELLRNGASVRYYLIIMRLHIHMIYIRIQCYLIIIRSTHTYTHHYTRSLRSQYLLYS